MSNIYFCFQLSKGKGDSRKPHTEKPAKPQSGAVKAFLQKREEEEKRKESTAKKTKQPENQQNTEPELDSVEFGGKRRVARMSDAEILETRKKLEAKRRADAAKWDDSDSDSGKKVEIKCEVITSRKPSSYHTSSSSSKKSSFSSKTTSHKSSQPHKDKSRDKHDKEKEKHKDRKKEYRKDERKEEKKKEKPKPKVVKRNQGPPPMSFAQLMSIANTNQDKPVAADGTEKPIEKPKDKPQRPMTQEEKDRIERRKSKEYQHWLKHGGKMPALPSHDKKTKGRPEPSSKAPSSVNSRPQKPMEKPKVEEVAKKKMEAARPQKNGHSAVGSNSSSKYGIVNEVVLSCGKDNSRKRPSHDDDDDEEKPQSTWDRIYNKVHKPKPPVKKPRIESEDEMDEYEDDFVEDDDELDDFIDDSEAVDYSSAIRDIFGYDKRKYLNEREDDISDMEANFDQISREEKLSARIGLKEDLEDIKREQEELRMKALKKKKRGKH
ncbi:hypothetical protein CAPTEDRAFT_228790 [Capitella teleta]|uniref:Uncharacterized protein n=1 Tax=Capitella teleta TaxID=283909 RepID=R7UXQ8_CAPTE|nr:hypothetical protein CAPTEDRAFT_228790 [Capitella teleta]|eukprot:ELU11363.1 hypothetical protein CAPTEDRAFT_228790 [Capitella teleta]